MGYFSGKNILICGGAGFIGINLLNKMKDSGAKIRATLNIKPAVVKHDSIEYVKGNLQNAEFCASIVDGIDFVFMLAANSSGAAVMSKTPLVHVTPNVIMNTLMLDASYTAGVKKFLFVSSNTVYPNTIYPVKEDEMLSGDPYDTYFCVGWMKRFSEIMCEMYSNKIKNPMKTVVIRPGNAYGEYDKFDWETSKVIAATIRKVVERHSPIEIWGDGKDIKDFIYVGDLVDGMLLAMEKMEHYTPLNIASGKPTTIRDVLAASLKIENYEEAKTIYNTSKPSMIPVRLIDVSKAKAVLGFTAKTSLMEGLKKTIDWYKTAVKRGE